jgi:putative transposase
VIADQREPHGGSFLKPSYIATSAHSVHQLDVHIIFVTKYRASTLTNAIDGALRDIFSEECDKMGCRLFRSKCDGNHVHAVIRFPPTISISKLAQQLKGASSYQIHKNFPDAPKPFWSPSYFAKTVSSISLDRTKKYIDEQDRENRPTRVRR